MDRTERLSLEVQDEWTPVFEKLNSHLEYLKKRIDDANMSITIFSIALSLTDTVVGRLLRSFYKLAFSKIGIGFIIAHAAVSGFGKGMKQVGGLVVKEFQMMIAVGKKFAPIIKTVVGGASAITEGIVNIAQKTIRLPFVEKFKAWGVELLNFQKGAENLKNRMTTVFKSFGEGTKALNRFTKEAAKTPFQIEQVTEAVATVGSFDIGTDNQDTMSKYIASIGNTAAATGRDIADLSYSFANATTGMMRGLKTVGITSADIRKELREEIDYATELGRAKIAEAVSRIMDKRFVGAMARYMEWTMGGLQSNLTDFVNTTKRKIGADLGLVAVNFLQRLSSVFVDLRNNSAKWDKVTKDIGYSFAVVARLVGDKIIGSVARLKDIITAIVADSRWKELWNAIARILAVVVDVLLDDFEEKVSRISASLYRAIPIINKIPPAIEKAWVWFDKIEELIYNGLIEKTKEWTRVLTLDKVLSVFSSVNKFITGMSAGWSALTGVVKIAIGLFLMFGGLFTGPIGSTIASLLGYIIVLWGGVDLGMSAAFATASSGFAALQKGVRSFLRWLDGIVTIFRVITATVKVFFQIINLGFKIAGDILLIFARPLKYIPKLIKDISEGFKSIGKSGKIDKKSFTFTGVFDKMTASMKGMSSKMGDLVTDFTSKIAAARDKAFSKEDRGIDKYKALRQLTEQIYSNASKTSALEESTAGLLAKQLDYRRELATSSSELVGYGKIAVASIDSQINALVKEKQAYLDMSLAYGEGAGLTNENRIKLAEYEGKIVDLQKARIDSGRKEQEQSLDILSQYSSIYTERASRYSDDMRYQGVRINSLKTELSFETARLKLIQNILKNENLGLVQRLKYTNMLEQQRTKVKQLNDEIRGTKEDDWITQAFGAVRGIENLAPTKASASYMAVSAPTPSYAALTVVVEDRRDLDRAINDKIIPVLEKKIYDESSTNYRPMSGY